MKHQKNKLHSNPKTEKELFLLYLEREQRNRDFYRYYNDSPLISNQEQFLNLRKFAKRAEHNSIDEYIDKEDTDLQELAIYNKNETLKTIEEIERHINALKEDIINKEDDDYVAQGDPTLLYGRTYMYSIQLSSELQELYLLFDLLNYRRKKGNIERSNHNERR